MAMLTLVSIVSYSIGKANARSGGSSTTESSGTTSVQCYDEHGHLIVCPYSKVTGIIVGSIFGVLFGGLLIWAMIDWVSKWRKRRRERVTESPGDLEASPAPFRKPPSKSWFSWLVPNMFSKYKGIPNRADTPDPTAHDASDATDDEDDKKHDHHENSKVPVPLSPTSEMSVPLPPYESVVHSPPIFMPPK